jgi:hypothetical protein
MVLGIDHRDAFAETVNVDTVGDLEHVRRIVRNQDDRDALVRTSRINSSTRRDSLTSSAAVGSSRTTIFEPKAAARATATPCL